MDATDGYILNLFRTETPQVSNDDFATGNVWVCDLLNQDFDLAKQYIFYMLTESHSNDHRLAFLFTCRQCFRYAISELNLYLEDPGREWRPTCCGEIRSPPESLRIYQCALNMVENAICHYQALENLICTDKEPDEKGKRNSEFTTARQVLAMYYLAEHLGIWGAVDKSGIESFTQFLTGKSRSEIHKKFKSPLDNKEDPEEKKKDFKFVKAHFEKLGLRDIVNQINRDMA